MNSIKKHTAVLLLLVSTFIVVPKELLHELTCHQDTTDAHCTTTEGLAISTIHHHCDILQLFITPFHSTDATIVFSNVVLLISHYCFNELSFSAEVVQRFVIRGPPSIL